MENRIVRVPISLILDPDLSLPAKLVWMALRLQPDAGTGDLMARTGLSRPSVLSTAGLLRAYSSQLPGPKVKLPALLLAAPKVGARAKLLYGLLQALPTCRGERGQFTYASLHDLTKLNPTTLKKAVKELADEGWIQLTQASRVKPIHFKLGSPAQRRRLAEAAAAQRRLNRAKFGGEALMQEYLSLLINSNQFADNVRPGFLVNPQTTERLELDRFYHLANVGFEFNGAQHYRATGQYTQAEADEQYFRDLIKAGLCLHNGLHLVVIHPEDLSLQAMRRRLPAGLPLRDLAEHEPLIDLLEARSIAYLAEAARKE